MNFTQKTPQMLLVSLLVLLFAGIVAMILGRKYSRQGAGLVWGALALLAGDLAFSWSVLVQDHFESQSWLRGWVWPRELVGSIMVGLSTEALGVFVSAMVVCVSAISLIAIGGMLKEARKQEARSDRLFAAIGISTAGVVLAWSSLTPWLGFLGISLSVFAGLHALRMNQETDAESDLTAQFGWERSSGLILSLMGGGIFAGSDWGQALAPTAGAWFGAALLLSGIFVQFQPFPLLGWVCRKTDAPIAARLLLNQAYPAAAAFALLIRLEPHMRGMPVFSFFGWFAIASVLVTVICGLFQSDWKRGLSVWFSAGMSLAAGVLVFSGRAPALSVFMSVMLGGVAWANAASALDLPGSSSKASTVGRKRAIWSRVIGFAGVAAGTGVFCFVGASGESAWLAQASQEPATAVLFAGAILAFALLGWRWCWNSFRKKSVTQVGWVAALAPLLLVLFSLSLVWKGSIAGGTIPGVSDQVLSNLLGLFFGSDSESGAAAANGGRMVLGEGIWMGLYWGAVIAGVAVAFWTAGREEDLWLQMRQRAPKAATFISSGYEVDHVIARILAAIAWAGRNIQEIVDTRLWTSGFPPLLDRTVRAVSSRVARADDSVIRGLNLSLRMSVEVPAKVLQMVQSGDVQWYLFFAIGSGIAMLMYFLRLGA